MHEALKMLHFLGIIMGVGAGMAGLAVAQIMAGAPPEAMAKVGKLRQTLVAISTTGLILLWLSGLTLAFAYYGMGIFADPWFSTKLLGVLVLTAISLVANLSLLQGHRNGTPPPAARMKALTLWSVVFGLFCVALAVITFG